MIYSYPWTPLAVSRCIFKSFPFTLTCFRLARVFNMPICFPCHFRHFITAKCPWRKSLECSLLWETNLISQLQLCTGHTGERFNGCAERKQCLLPSQQKQSSSKEKEKKGVKCQAVCSQQIMKWWIIDFLRNCYFILILQGRYLVCCNTLNHTVSWSVNSLIQLQTRKKKCSYLRFTIYKYPFLLSLQTEDTVFCFDKFFAIILLFMFKGQIKIR